MRLSALVLTIISLLTVACGSELEAVADIQWRINYGDWTDDGSSDDFGRVTTSQSSMRAALLILKFLKFTFTSPILRASSRATSSGSNVTWEWELEP